MNRDELKRQTEEFLAQGGVVQKCEPDPVGRHERMDSPAQRRNYTGKRTIRDLMNYDYSDYDYGQPW